MDPTGPFRSESTAGAASGTFELHGRSGSVWVAHGVNADSRSVGLWHSGVALYDPILARGFPVIEALVRYSGEGCLAFMAWIQVVRYTYENDPEVIQRSSTSTRRFSPPGPLRRSSTPLHRPIRGTLARRRLPSSPAPTR